jgi:hypothetical protein
MARRTVRGEVTVDRPEFPTVAVVPDLDVDFELDTNPDGTQTVHLRHGLLIAEPHAALINEVASQRQRLTCLICAAELLHRAGFKTTLESLDTLAWQLAKTEHQRHTADVRHVLPPQRDTSAAEGMGRPADRSA